MLSPDHATLSAYGSSTRNPRRRSRVDSEPVRHQPHRKRSKISEDFFTTPANGKINGNGGLGMNGHASGGSGPRSAGIPLRERKSSMTKRNVKSDGSTILARNANYAVKRLPSYPAHLRDRPSESYRAFFHPPSNFALALTHDNAIVWDYAVSTNAPVTYTLALPFGLKETDPLPIGSIVKSGSSDDVGAVAVSPSTGDITFWESVDSAESLGLFKTVRNSVEGNVGGLFSGETITDIVDAEHTGFVLQFSSGRLAQLTLRDHQGRPKISVSFFRLGGAGSGGIFGSIKNVFTGFAWRKDISAVVTRPSAAKGQVEVIIGTKSGSFQIWEMSWAGQHIFKNEINAQEDFRTALRSGQSSDAEKSTLSVELLDFSVVESAKGDGESGQHQPLRLLCLLSYRTHSSSGFDLVEIEVLNDSVSVQRIIPIYAYEDPILRKESYPAKLLVPSPGHTAFVLMKKAVVVASLAHRRLSPEDQLMIDSGKPPRPYQDAVQFKKSETLEFVGSALQESGFNDDNSNCVIAMQGFGVIRFTSFAPSSQSKSEERQRVTAKSKIEQAVFFGAIPSNIIDFSPTPQNKSAFQAEEIEKAALKISYEILESKSNLIPPIMASTEQHLDMRARALAGLASHLRANYRPLSRAVKWQLLWNAEKLAAAQGMWKYHDEREKANNINQQELLAELIDLLHERYKSKLRSEVGELDKVREWFAKDVTKISVVIPWAFNAIKEIYSEGVRDHASVMQLVSEADDLTRGALQSAFVFREEHLDEYGLSNESMHEGVLRTGYEDLPQFWTSSHLMVNNTRQLVDLSREMVFQYSEHAGTGEGIPNHELISKVALDNPHLVQLSCRLHTERYLWCLAQSDEATRAIGRAIQHDFETKIRHKQLTALSQIGMAYEGMRIAEAYRDMPTLVHLVWDELVFLASSKDEADSRSEAREASHKLREMYARIQQYFNRYGDDWAEAYYSYLIETGRESTLFSPEFITPETLTKFLRDNPSRAKIGWINEILTAKDFAAAGSALFTIATEQETNTWSKGVESSLAKLSLMAAQSSKSGVRDNSLIETSAKVENEGKLVALQEELFRIIMPVFIEGIDRDLGYELVRNTFANSVEDKPALKQLLERGFEQVIDHVVMDPPMLIDVLTLMDHNDVLLAKSNAPLIIPTDSADFRVEQFLMALRVLEASCTSLSPDVREDGKALIYKRVFGRDDWSFINDTSSLTDEEVAERLQASTTYGFLLGVEAANFVTALSNPSHSTTSNPAFSLLPPSAIIGAGTNPTSLASRFTDEDLQLPIARDNAADDPPLQHALEHYRLEHWVSAMRDLATAELRRQADEILRIEEEKTRRMRQAEQELFGTDDMYGPLGGQYSDDDVDDAGDAGSDGFGTGTGFEGDDEREMETSVGDADGDAMELDG